MSEIPTLKVGITRQASFSAQEELGPGSHVVSCTSVCLISIEGQRIPLVGLQQLAAMRQNQNKLHVQWRTFVPPAQESTIRFLCAASPSLALTTMQMSSSFLYCLWQFYLYFSPMYTSSSKIMAVLDLPQDNRKSSRTAFFAAQYIKHFRSKDQPFYVLQPIT